MKTSQRWHLGWVLINRRYANKMIKELLSLSLIHKAEKTGLLQGTVKISE